MKPVILLVEDNPDLLKMLALELGDLYVIVKAMNGQQALNALTNAQIQLVISDVMMPVMDGFELCRAIKTNPAYNHLPVILLTAKNTLRSKIEGIGLGADAYIEKPFDMELLLVQIANLLSNRQKLKQHFAHSPIMHLKAIASNHSDEAFLEKLNETIQAHLDDRELDVEKLARLMNTGRTNLFAKIKTLTDLTPNELINVIRLKKAASLLADGNFRIFEVSYMVGYASHSHFGRNFQKQFGMTPREYYKSKHPGG